MPHGLGPLSRTISSETFQGAERGKETQEGMEEQNTVQLCSHRLHRSVAKDREPVKSKSFVPWGLFFFLLSENPGSLQGCPWENSFPMVSPTGTTGKRIHFWKYCCWAERQLLLILYAGCSGPTMIGSTKPKKDRWGSASGSISSIYLGFNPSRSDRKSSPFSSSFKACCRLPDPPLIFDLSPYGCN